MSIHLRAWSLSVLLLFFINKIKKSIVDPPNPDPTPLIFVFFHGLRVWVHVRSHVWWYLVLFSCPNSVGIRSVRGGMSIRILILLQRNMVMSRTLLIVLQVSIRDLPYWHYSMCAIFLFHTPATTKQFQPIHFFGGRDDIVVSLSHSPWYYYSRIVDCQSIFLISYFSCSGQLACPC